MSLWSRKPFIALRVFDHDGHYPSFSIRTEAHAYHAADDLIWTAAVQRPLDPEWELGEITVLVPEEVRLLAAVTLSEADPWNRGLPVMSGHPLATRHLDPEAIGLDLRVPATQAALMREAHDIRPALNAWRGERPERAISDIGDVDDALALLANIDVSDQLLLAGLARLLGAARLMNAHEHEEAAIILFVSMGAAFEFLKQHLCAEAGTDDVPFSAVSEYFCRTFPEGDGIATNFAEYYEHRVIATHPLNRYGEFWAPPIMASDLYHLRKSVMSLYRHILLGEII